MRGIAALRASLAMVLAVGCFCEHGGGAGMVTAVHGPSTAHVDARLQLNVPAALAQQYHVPARMDGTLTADARSEPVAGMPNRSRHRATIAVRLSDPTGQATYLELKTTVSGEGDRTPSEAIWQAFGELARSMDLLGRSLSQVGEHPGGASTRPSTQPIGLLVNIRATADSH